MHTRFNPTENARITFWECDMHVPICRREKSLLSYVLTQASCVARWSQRELFYSTESWGWKLYCDDGNLGLYTCYVCTGRHIHHLNKHTCYNILCQRGNIQINNCTSSLVCLVISSFTHISTHKRRTKRGLWSVLTKPEYSDVSELFPHSIVRVGEEHGWCKLRQRQILISLLQKAGSSVVFHVLAAEAFPVLCSWIQPDLQSTAGELRAQTAGIAFCSGFHVEVRAWWAFACEWV